MSLLQLAIIATLQGITEWLPISSSAHVLLASDTFGVTGQDELLINAVSNLGTLAAMLIYFRKDVDGSHVRKTSSRLESILAMTDLFTARAANWRGCKLEIG